MRKPSRITTLTSSLTATAAAYRAEGRAMDTLPPLRFVTASLHVDNDRKN